jgi:hypothetical protein
MEISNGLYYGHNRGFFPQSIIYVNINDSLALVSGFYPLKGLIFSTFIDTLYYSKNKNMFFSNKSTIYFEKKKLYVERKDSLLVYKVDKTRIRYNSRKIEDYLKVKKSAIPYKEFYNEK